MAAGPTSSREPRGRRGCPTATRRTGPFAFPPLRSGKRSVFRWKGISSTSAGRGPFCAKPGDRVGSVRGRSRDRLTALGERLLPGDARATVAPGRARPDSGGAQGGAPDSPRKWRLRARDPAACPPSRGRPRDVPVGSSSATASRPAGSSPTSTRKPSRRRTNSARRDARRPRRERHCLRPRFRCGAP